MKLTLVNGCVTISIPVWYAMRRDASGIALRALAFRMAVDFPAYSWELRP